MPDGRRPERKPLSMEEIMARQPKSPDGVEFRTIHETVRGLVLAHALSAPLAVKRVMFELAMT